MSIVERRRVRPQHQSLVPAGAPSWMWLRMPCHWNTFWTWRRETMNTASDLLMSENEGENKVFITEMIRKKKSFDMLAMCKCESIESISLLHKLPVETHMTGHLQPRPTVLLSSTSLSSKADHFQLALTKKAYKSAALNVLCLLTVYQVRILGWLGTQLHWRKNQSFQIYVFVSNAPIFSCTFNICWQNSLPGTGRVSLHFTGGNSFTAEQRCNMCSTSRTEFRAFFYSR